MQGLAGLVTFLNNNPQILAGAGAVISKAGSSGLLGGLGGLFGAYALPLAVVGYGVISLLQTHGVVTDSTTVDTTTAASVILGGGGLIPWMRKASSLFSKIDAFITNNQPPSK
jgi:hypothetical protein